LVETGNCSEDGFLHLLLFEVEATDLCGNVTNFRVSIQVVDTEGPVFIGDTETTISCGDELPALTAEDLCTSVVSLTVEDQNVISDVCSDEPLLRLWTATDECGNESTMVQTVHIVDDKGPELIGVPNDTCDVIP